MLLTLRSAANPRAAAIMRDSIERNYQRRLADALPGPDTTSRAALLIAICAGVILDRMLLGHTELNSPGTESLVPYLHAAPGHTVRRIPAIENNSVILIKVNRESMRFLLK